MKTYHIYTAAGVFDDLVNIKRYISEELLSPETAEATIAAFQKPFFRCKLSLLAIPAF